MSETPEIVSGQYAAPRKAPGVLRVVDWNIDRGEHMDNVLDFLERADADLLLLQEVDINDRRTGFRNVADEIARRLRLNYVWGREFQELVQGTSDSRAYIGQATLTRWPIVRARRIPFRNQSGFWHPHWFVPHVSPFQVRIGGRIAMACEIDLGGRRLAVYNLHLESRNTDRLRAAQLAEVLRDASPLGSRAPVILAGDFNMNTMHPAIARQIQEAGFRAVFDGAHPTARFLFVSAAIDWAFVRGPVRASRAKVESSVRGSDHVPLSFQVTL